MVQTWGWLVRRSHAESNLKGYGKKVCIGGGGRVMEWVSASRIIQTVQTTTRSNFAEFRLNGRGKNFRALGKGSLLESESEFVLESVPQ